MNQSQKDTIIHLFAGGYVFFRVFIIQDTHYVMFLYVVHYIKTLV